MKKLSFLVNRGEDDCFMVHGLDWATYAEGRDWNALTRVIQERAHEAFFNDPLLLNFVFPDGTIVSMSA